MSGRVIRSRRRSDDLEFPAAHSSIGGDTEAVIRVAKLRRNAAAGRAARNLDLMPPGSAPRSPSRARAPALADSPPARPRSSRGRTNPRTTRARSRTCRKARTRWARQSPPAPAPCSIASAYPPARTPARRPTDTAAAPGRRARRIPIRPRSANGTVRPNCRQPVAICHRIEPAHAHHRLRRIANSGCSRNGVIARPVARRNSSYSALVTWQRASRNGATVTRCTGRSSSRPSA